MYELEVIQSVNYIKFDEIAEIKRKGADVYGKLFVGDKVKVKTKAEADYLCGDNFYGVVACKIISEPVTKVERVEVEVTEKETFFKKETKKKKHKTPIVD